MNNFEKNITFVIVSFKSSYIIEKCIQSINSNIKIIIVENSNNFVVKKYLENKGIPCLIHYPISIAETNAIRNLQIPFDDVKNCLINSKEIRKTDVKLLNIVFKIVV